MGPATHILHALAQLTLTALDVTIFFVLVRMAHRWHPNTVLAAFDQAGSQLVDGLKTKVVHWWMRFKPVHQLTETQELMASLVLVTGLRIVIVLLLGAVAPS